MDWQADELESGPYQHELAPFSVVDGGAEEYAFRMFGTLPLISFRGAARVAGQFLPFGAGEPNISLHPTGAPQGMSFENGTIYTQDSENNQPDGLPGEGA